MENTNPNIIAPNTKVLQYILVFYVTTRCNSGCRHCFLNDDQERQDMKASDFNRLIAEASLIDQIKTLCFSGGEPFRLGTKLNSYIYEAAKMGFDISVITSCNWARSYQVAHDKLRKLYESGLTELIVSVDEYHSEKIASKNVINTIEAAEKIGLSTFINYKYSRNTSLDTIENEVNRLIGRAFDSAKIVYGPIYNIGRAKDKIDTKVFSGLDREIKQCTGMYITIYPTGEVVSCGCAVNCKNSHGLYVGNINNESIQTLYNKWVNDPIMLYLQTEGLESLFKEAQNFGISNAAEAEGCEKCMSILSNSEFSSYLRSKYGQKKEYSMLYYKRFLMYQSADLVNSTLTLRQMER